MRVQILTIFPELFAPFLSTSLVGRAIEGGLLQVEVANLRDFTTDRHRSVDDDPYGGGGGMVMSAQPFLSAVEQLSSVGEPVAEAGESSRRPWCVLMSPQGERLAEAKVRELALRPELILLCGRYEGIDERVREAVVDEEVSIGDYVLSGGELPAMVLVEAMSRQVSGVVGLAESVENDSFRHGLLDYPHYTRPRSLPYTTHPTNTGQSLEVPEVLLGGNHAEIETWREHQALVATVLKRPDLLTNAELTASQRRQVAAIAEEHGVTLPVGLQRRN